MLNRIAPRRSPRPRRKLRSASSTATESDERPHDCAHEETDALSRCAARTQRLRSWARVHGATISKYTGFPSAAAASIRIGTSGRSGYAPSHAARASAKIGGIHRGFAGENCAIGRPASANSDFQSAAVPTRTRHAPSCDVSICSGTARRLTSRPVRSSVSDSIPERVVGGFSGVTMLAPPIGTSGRGLWRYQNRSAGG